jgi:fructose-1,6-bisphosphatase II
MARPSSARVCRRDLRHRRGDLREADRRSDVAAGGHPELLHEQDQLRPAREAGPGRIRLDNSVQDNLEIIALKLGKRVQDLTVVILDRPRHERLIHDVRRAGAAIRLISDGDIAGAIAPCLPGSGVDVYMGTGGSPEAVLAAAASSASAARSSPRCGRATTPRRASLKATASPTRPGQGLHRRRPGRGKRILFAATGISDSAMLKGIRYEDTSAITHSILMRAKHQTIRYIQTCTTSTRRRCGCGAMRRIIALVA